MAALMLPLPSAVTAEEKRTLVRTDAIPRTIEDHTFFKKIGIPA